jgi:putative transposase
MHYEQSCALFAGALPARRLPIIMHWLNWFTAMCFNRMLNRTGHFWEKRYHSTGFPNTDKRRALNTLRYIHGNPKAANMQQGWFYDFSNYGSYDRLTHDGLTQWHPAFLAWEPRWKFVRRPIASFARNISRNPSLKSANRWGSKNWRVLSDQKMKAERKALGKKACGTSGSYRWMRFRMWPKQFVLANCLNPDIAAAQFTDTT